jgi:prepilin peptidase CpaA
MGWGDVKLMAAVGALLGWPLFSWHLVLYALFYTVLVGAVVAVIVALYQKKLTAALKATVALPRRRRVRARSGVTIPYGVAIALGTIWAVATRYFPQLLVG